MRLSAFMEGVLDVAGASPRRRFFEVLAHFATTGLERERLQYFATSEGRDDLYTYNQREGRTLLEVLQARRGWGLRAAIASPSRLPHPSTPTPPSSQDFKSARPPLAFLLEAAPLLRPRQFSLSSSPAAHPGAAHLTVAVVEWTTPFKRKRRGLCSSWLASLAPGCARLPLSSSWHQPRTEDSEPLRGADVRCAQGRGAGVD